MEFNLAIKSISNSSSPDLNGFKSSFYVACWDIIKEAMLEASKVFFSGGHLSKFYTSSYMVLIPKVKDHLRFDKFRSISMCSIVYKILSKIIFNVLMSYLNLIISPEQGAFLSGRSIFDSITLALKMVH